MYARSTYCRLIGVVMSAGPLCCSSSTVERSSPCDGGVFQSNDSISISSGGPRSMDWSQGCDTVIAPTHSPAAEYTFLRCHSNRRQQNTQTDNTFDHYRSLSFAANLQRILSHTEFVGAVTASFCYCQNVSSPTP